MNKSNQSVEKTLLIMETLAKFGGPMRLVDIAAKVDMPASTVLRMLLTLVKKGYAYQEKDGRYALTLRMLFFGQLVADHINLNSVAHELVDDLSRKIGETCCIAIRENNLVRYTDVCVGRIGSLSIRQRIGGTAQIYSTGSGKVLLMQRPESEIEQYLLNTRLLSLTPKTITDPEVFRHELKKCLGLGYAVDDEECELGMRCIAVPVHNMNHEVIAAISASGPEPRMSSDRYENEILPLLRDTAKEIERKMNGDHSEDI